VDVSTSAQATLGGMAGNNSCGSRSIAYGNMVHNVLGATAWLSDGSEVAFGPVGNLHGRAARDRRLCARSGGRNRDDIEANWPKVLRRVAGYNLDIFDNQNERPYTNDGSVNLAHLLVGSEGTLAFTKDLTLKLVPCRAIACWAWSISPASMPRWIRPAYRAAESQRGRAGGPHHDRAGAVQSGFRPTMERR
jgi:FAD/FMN-containing dehydrogenase